MMLGSILYSRAVSAGRSVKLMSALLGAAAVVCCPQAAAQNPPSAVAQTGSLVQRIAQSQQRLDAQRLHRANSPSGLANTYIAEKAQCWLDFSRHEALRNNPSPVPAQAQEKAQALVNTLEAGDAPVTNTLLDSALPAMPASQRMRNDLWLRLDAVKATSAMLCSAKAVACAEVMLVQAAHLHQRIDWRYARPYFGMAEDLVSQAQEQAKTCK
jgi:hypothetical protein